MMIEITDEDITKVEGKFNLTFDDESKTFIKCMESKDIKACPGAGKTTSLVAKLDILANNMPFDDNSGILVLTHTNVAVDEIKKKLGANAKIVLGYPNHVGTFQSFINKFLAIPMYIKLIGKKPERIDSEIFYMKYESILKSYHESVFGWLSSSGEVRNISPIQFLEGLTLNDNEDEFKYNNQGKVVLTSKKKSFFFKNIKKVKDRNIENELVQKGYLTYSHCYEFVGV